MTETIPMTENEYSIDLLKRSFRVHISLLERFKFVNNWLATNRIKKKINKLEKLKAQKYQKIDQFIMEVRALESLNTK